MLLKTILNNLLFFFSYPVQLIDQLVDLRVRFLDFFFYPLPFICLLVADFVEAFVQGEDFIYAIYQGFLRNTWRGIRCEKSL
jgi:hypothetical protein